MNRELIGQWAKEAGFHENTAHTVLVFYNYAQYAPSAELERFARLVAAHTKPDTEELEALRKDFDACRDALDKSYADLTRYRVVMEQAVEALDKTMQAWKGTCAWHGDVKEALTALREALEEGK